MILSLVLFLFAVPERVEDLRLLQTIDLHGTLHHVQGIEVEPDRLWVTSVDRETRKGFLHVFELPSGKHIRSVEVQQGTRYHPGGIQADGNSLWIPVADYSRTGTSVIERRDKRTLAALSRFEVPDHIGCIAVAGDRLIGGNWDSRTIYYWNKAGKLLASKPNPTPNRHQDLKVVNGKLVASGKLSGSQGAIDWLEPDSLKLTRRLLGGNTDRGVSFMNEGMALAGEKLYLLPEDGPSRLFIFQLK